MIREVLHPAVHIIETFGANMVGWMLMISIWYDGESHDYIYEVGGARETEQQAHDNAKRQQCRRRAIHSFLQAVDLRQERN